MGILAVNFFVYAVILDYNVLFVENDLCNCYSRRTCCARCSQYLWLQLLCLLLSVYLGTVVSAPVIIVYLVSTLCALCSFFVPFVCTWKRYSRSSMRHLFTSRLYNPRPLSVLYREVQVHHSSLNTALNIQYFIFVYSDQIPNIHRYVRLLSLELFRSLPSPPPQIPRFWSWR